jgi:lysine/ornithine N-monooxygenase
MSEKGTHGHECYRTACKNSPATYFNQSTHKYYCAECASTINELNRADAMQLFKSELCIEAEKPVFKSFWWQLSDKDRFLTLYAHMIHYPGISQLSLMDIFNQANPSLIIQEDRRSFRIAAESIDIMRETITNYFKL